MNSTPLDQLASRAADNPFFLGFRLRAYATAERLDDPALAARLGCEPATLAQVRLCRAPREDSTGFREDVLAVASAFGLNATALAAAAKHGLATVKRDACSAEPAGVLLAARDRDEQP